MCVGSLGKPPNPSQFTIFFWTMNRFYNLLTTFFGLWTALSSNHQRIDKQTLGILGKPPNISQFRTFWGNSRPFKSNFMHMHINKYFIINLQLNYVLHNVINLKLQMNYGIPSLLYEIPMWCQIAQQKVREIRKFL